MHARIHDDDKSQDMRNMGGLRKYMPVTFWTFLASTLAIIGFPLTSGFFSKDEILFKAMTTKLVHPMHDLLTKRKVQFYEPPALLGPVLYWVGLAAATMTAFYMCRLLIQTFFGEFKGWKIGKPAASTSHGDDHAHRDHHHDDLTKPGKAPHESPLAMTAPLIILAAFAVFAGILNPGLLKHVLHLESLPLEHWLEPLFEASTEGAKAGIQTVENAGKLEWLCTLGAFSAFAIGAGTAYWMYIVQNGAPAARLAKTVPWLHQMLLNKWKVDEFYDYTVLSGVDALADTSAAVDRGIVDMLIAKVSAVVVAALGTLLRALQTGVMHFYAAMMVVGLGAFGWFFVAPHAEGTVTDKGNGDYVVTAAPGLGYSFSFVTVDAKTEPVPFNVKLQKQVDTEAVHVDEGGTKVIELRTMNAFRFWTSRKFIIERPKAPEVIEVGQN
jgi:NADH-quinone oxidoreductase subunit L